MKLNSVRAEGGGGSENSISSDRVKKVSDQIEGLEKKIK